jgi:hypothetical protein
MTSAFDMSMEDILKDVATWRFSQRMAFFDRLDKCRPRLPDGSVVAWPHALLHIHLGHWREAWLRAPGDGAADEATGAT